MSSTQKQPSGANAKVEIPQAQAVGMSPELKSAWVAALRSGEYKQCTGQFQEGNCYCCLGVLCLAAQKPIQGDLGDNYEFVRQALNASSPQIPNDPVVILTGLNDTRRMKFPEIADWIEANIPASVPTKEGE